MNIRNLMISAGVAVMSLSLAGGALADSGWQHHHSRREEVNQRLARQNHRITQERRDGEITRTQARDLRMQDRGIRAQERYASSRNGGHISRVEQRRLNQQENRVSRQIGR